MKALGLIACVLSSIAAILIGLNAVNVSVLGYLADGKLVYIIKPIQILLGLAGIYNLYSALAGSCCK